MAEGLLKLKWNSHLSSFSKVLESLRTKARYTDVTLACDGRLFAVHRLILASCSQFFDHIFEQTPAENTVIVLNEAKASDVESLLDYMYCGEVDVLQGNLGSFLRTAECLQIKGLAVPDEDYENSELPIHAVEAPRKRRRCDKLSHSNLISAATDQPNHNREIAQNNSSNTSSVPSPPMPNIIPSQWVFQKGDLPNTTWSSQGQMDSVIIENDTTTESPKNHKEKRRLLVSGNTEGGSSQARLINVTSMPSGYYKSHSSNSDDRSTPETVALRISEPDALDIKKEIKEEKEYISEEIDGLKDSLYSQELALRPTQPNNTNERTAEDSPSDLRQSTTIKTFSTTDDHSTKLISITTPSERHAVSASSAKATASLSSNIHNSLWDSITSSSGENAFGPIVGANTQTTLSPKLMPYAKCSNCYTNNTKLWRRSMNGEIVCNACGLYFKLHGVNRPSHLFRNAPMTRRRNPKKKRKGDDIGDGKGEQYNSSEEIQDSFYNESGCDADTQEGLAVLNAALTLNSLFAKAKAQEAAAKNSAPVSSSSGRTTLSHEASSSSSPIGSQFGCEGSTTETRPPPALLKLPLQGAPPKRPSSYFTPISTTDSWKESEENLSANNSLSSDSRKGHSNADDDSIAQENDWPQDTNQRVSRHYAVPEYQKNIVSESRISCVREGE